MGDELVDAIEFTLSAQALYEFDAQVGVVDVVVEVEDVAFDGESAAVVEGGAESDVGDGGSRAFGQMSEGGVDAGAGDGAVCADGDVGGGEADGASALEAEHDGSVDGEAASEQCGDALDCAVVECGADFGGGDFFGLLAVVGDEVDDVDLEAEFCAEAGEGVGVAAALASEREVFADDEAFELEFFDEHADEVAGFGLGEFGGEADGGDGVEAGFEEEREAVFEAGDVFEGEVAAEHFAGVWVEGDCAGGEVVSAGACDHFTDHGLVSAVDAVEDADGECGGSSERGASELFASEGGDHRAFSCVAVSCGRPVRWPRRRRPRRPAAGRGRR